MSSVENAKVHGKAARMAACAAAALALAWGGIAAAQAVVVRSTGPSAAQYPMGRKLPATASVSLKAGDHVTVIDKAGTRVLNGPGTFAVTGAVNRDQAGTMALAGLVARTGGARVRTGAVRGATSPVATPAGPDSVWYLDVTKGGTFCAADPAQIVLWRPDRTETGMGKLIGPDGASADVTWNAGNALKLWPAEALPIVDGQSYSFRNPVGRTLTIKLKVLPAVPEDAVAVAGLLAEQGCTAQLDVFANAANADGANGG
ncbi:hypothetical protein OLX02_01235 [Novosphingobium sp. KCTC 2891]|uniref:hypothetical protein n=1 Tax=Novosphingobium sp. KCTC 2891 TaxID=2989730 RepID=UPI00222156D4|nr:hypothetical protein [Novosphingobium sp. KCTC 2891]MCW1381436.1 hypothetical protein [Novosphingobium sp. KCTC 2891]